MANEPGPFVCLHLGCERHERYEYAMKRHVFQEHDVPQDEQEQGRDYGTQQDVALRQLRRTREAEVACWSFRKLLDRVGGADDFVNLCKAFE